MLALRGHEAVFLQNFDVMLDRSIFERESRGELIQIARPISELMDYSCPIFSATGSP